MDHFTRILYLCDVHKDDDHAAKQALNLAMKDQAKLFVWVVGLPLPEVFSAYSDSLKTGFVAKAKQCFSRCCQQLGLDESSIDVEFDTIASRHPSIDIIKEVIRHDVDVVVKSADDRVGHTGFSATDMSFLRKCPAPVWLCRPMVRHRDEIRVAVAVDPDDELLPAKKLNNNLLDYGKALADNCNGTLNVVSCWEFELETVLRSSVWLKITESELQKQIKASERVHRSALDMLLKKTQGKKAVFHINGRPAEAIPQFVNEHDIDVLIMGTVARTGIPGLMIGNTAENIVNQLDCTLLAIKPTGFVSPISWAP